MFNSDEITNENNKEYNLKWPYISDHPDRILIIGGSGSGKTNALLNSMKEQENGNVIDKIYLYAKDLNESKYQFLITRREDVGTKHLNDPQTFVEYSQCMDDVYNNIDDYNPNRNRKILIVFDDINVDIKLIKNFKP